MKLLVCLRCNDVRKLTRGEWVYCRCGDSAGRYLSDGHNAEYAGSARLLGMANSDVEHALRRDDHPSIRAWAMAVDGPRWTYKGDVPEIT